MRTRFLKSVSAAVTMACLLWPALAEDLASFEITLVDGQAHGYGTFQSHNQKVIEHGGGIYMTHIRSRNAEYTAQQWRLSRSTNGGKSFETIHEATHATNPPVLEAGADGPIFLARPDFVDGNAYLYRFAPSGEVTLGDPVTLEGGAAGKYCMLLDEPRGQLCFFSHNNRFFTIDTATLAVSRVDLLKGGTNAVLQYPQLSLGLDGALHAAWTTQKHGVYMYWDIHHMLSEDGGASWRTMSGTPIALPAVADNTGRATRISLEDEFESHTWLSSFTAHEGKVHFMYMAQTAPPREHYVRYDIASGEEEIRVQPTFAANGRRIQSLDGFFAKGHAHGELYAVGSYQGRLVCLRTNDNGATWNGHAQSAETYNAYSVGGCRTVSEDGYILGSFVDQAGSNDTGETSSKVYFFKVRAGAT